ncbi:MAG: ParB/RepB/Spo0J family partition protein [Candidatus Omnitrophica bacterium]|nr:ParB/RepB/Spo0J family partition protein [Candidatus Omnitrophota bacterium]
MKRKALGRGLSALLSEAPVEPIDQKTVLEIPLDSLEANRYQPRTIFEEESLKELAESIRTQGILQPLLVRLHPNDSEKYQILAGERRFRSALMAELATAPCIVLEAEEAKAMEIALVENLQRTDLSPVEEARAFKSLADRFALTQEDIAKRVGKSRAAITNALRLLLLPKEIIHALETEDITVGHAKALLSLRESRSLMPTFERVVEEGLSVRETEQLVHEILYPSRMTPPPPPKPQKEEDVNIKALEKSLESLFRTKVRVKMKSKKKGAIEIQFYDLDQLDDILKSWKIRL